jgi:hypothetical protein
MALGFKVYAAKLYPAKRVLKLIRTGSFQCLVFIAVYQILSFENLCLKNKMKMNT